MGRLIDADRFINQLTNEIWTDYSKDAVIKMINNQPTAYDVDGTIKLMEKLKANNEDDGREIDNKKSTFRHMHFHSEKGCQGMNNQEAIESITDLKNDTIKDNILNQALCMAISALEQQITKEAMEEQGISPRCPYCENANYLTNEDGEENNCCGNCGQAIDWGVEDE